MAENLTTRSRRQLSVVCLQLAWLEEQRSSLAETIAVIDQVILSGQQWIHQDIVDMNFSTLCQAIEQTSAYVVQKCSDILNENCSPLLYLVDNHTQAEEEINQKQDIEHGQEISDEIEFTSVSGQTDIGLSTSEPEVNENAESNCRQHRTNGDISRLGVLDDTVIEFNQGEFQTDSNGLEFFEKTNEFWGSNSEGIEIVLDQNLTEGIDMNSIESITLDLMLDTTTGDDRVRSDIHQMGDSIGSESVPQKPETISSDLVSPETADLESESEPDKYGVKTSDFIQEDNINFHLQEAQRQDPQCKSLEMTNSKHETQTVGETYETISEEESIDQFFEFLINMLVTSLDSNPIQCLIKGVDSVDGKFLERVTERKSHDPIKDQLIKELTNRRLYYYKNRENLSEPASQAIQPKGILRYSEAKTEPPTEKPITGMGVRKKVTFNDNKSGAMKIVLESFRKPVEETVLTTKSEFEDKGKNVTLLGVKHFSEFFDGKLEPSASVQKELPKKNIASGKKYEPTITKRPPAFTACIPYGTFHTVTTGATITSFDDVISNIGNHFNPKTGEFTAPLSGVYVTSVTLRQVGAGYVGIDVIKKTNTTSGRSEQKVSGAHTLGNDMSASCLAVVELMAGDRIYLKGLQRGEAQLNMYSSFSCFMLT